MHIVPAPAESLMKSRVLSIPGLQGVMDGLGMDTGFSDFRQVWGARRATGGQGKNTIQNWQGKKFRKKNFLTNFVYSCLLKAFSLCDRPVTSFGGAWGHRGAVTEELSGARRLKTDFP